MGLRQANTGTYFATNWVDITSCLMFVFHMLLFIVPFVTWPFHWLKEETLDWVIAWTFVNMIAEALPALNIVFFFWYLIVAIGSGVGSENICEDVNGTNVCYYDVTYVSSLDGWLTWAIYTILAGGSYFTMFYFGADAVRYLRPDGGYDLYYLYPSLIYDLLVIFGVAPDASRSLTGHSELFYPE